MAIKKSVFGSDSERELYKSINSEWSDKFNIWPGLSFLDIFNLNQIQLKLKPSKKQVDFLKMTTVDFTVCNKNTGEPILSIEFDGMCRGYSRLGKYVQIHNAPDVPMRKEKLELKLKVADTFEYPFFIVSYPEKNPIGEELHLTIVDGIIGQCLAKKETKHLIKEKLELEKECLEALPPDELDIVFQYIVTDAEVDADFLHDPIVLKTAEYSSKLMKSGFESGFHIEYLRHPLDDSEEWPPTIDNWVTKILTTDMLGCRITLHFPLKEFEEEVWVRNFWNPHAAPGLIAENLARLLAFKRAYDYFLGGANS